jgi:hypothetical protein
LRSRWFFLLCALLFAVSAAAQQIDLFDGYGAPVAYVDHLKRDTLFLWSGEPVAYLLDGSVFGFNGAHLGWLQDGVLWGHSGEALGFTAPPASAAAATQDKPKGNQLPLPVKLMRDVEPLKPLFRGAPAQLPLRGLLAQGAGQ